MQIVRSDCEAYAVGSWGGVDSAAGPLTPRSILQSDCIEAQVLQTEQGAMRTALYGVGKIHHKFIQMSRVLAAPNHNAFSQSFSKRDTAASTLGRTGLSTTFGEVDG